MKITKQLRFGDIFLSLNLGFTINLLQLAYRKNENLFELEAKRSIAYRGKSLNDLNLKIIQVKL